MTYVVIHLAKVLCSLVTGALKDVSCMSVFLLIYLSFCLVGDHISMFLTAKEERVI